MSTPPPFKGAGTPLNSPGAGNKHLLDNHPSLGRQTTGQANPSSSNLAVPIAATTSSSTASRNPHRPKSASRPNRCEHCLLLHRRCDGTHPQCGECKKKDRECIWPTTGEEIISRSQMERRVAERQQRELEQQGFLETNLSESAEEAEGNDDDDDDIEIGGLGQAERRFEQGIFRPVSTGLANFGSGMQEEDLLLQGTSRRRTYPSTREDGDGSGVDETLPLGTSRRPPDPPTRGDSERSDVDESVPATRGVKRRQPGDRWERKKSPEGERIGRHRVKVARTAEAVGATPPEPEELTLGETGIVTVTDQSFVREHGVNIEGVNTDNVETGNALPSATEAIFDATTRLFDDHISDLQATDCSAPDTTTQVSLNWHTQPFRRPNGTHNPVISADSAMTFLPAVPRQGEQAGTPTAELLRQRQEAPVLTERDTSLEELDANEFEVAEELTQAGGAEMRGDAGQDFVENIEAIERAGPSTVD